LLKSLTFSALAVTVAALAPPAQAQHTRLEDAWNVCAGIAGSGRAEAALASSATAAGFPQLEPGFHGLRDEQGQVVVLGIERPLDGVVHCMVGHNGGEQADLAARAERFWRARGYVATNRRSAIYSGVESLRFTSVAVSAEGPDFWETSVEWDLD
jgi:hypothetical protein